MRVYCREKVFDSFTGWKSVEYASKSVVLDSRGDAEDLTPGVLQRCLGVSLDGEAGSGREVVAGWGRAGIRHQPRQRVPPHLKNAGHVAVPRGEAPPPGPEALVEGGGKNVEDNEPSNKSLYKALYDIVKFNRFSCSALRIVFSSPERCGG